MPEVADAFRRFGSRYQEAHGAAMLPSHRRAIADIIACRTEALGGQQWCCNHCGALLLVFHSCRNRACPKCHAEQTQAWLEQRREEMLPVPYFHVTVTVPEQLRAALRRHQIDGYGALMKAAAEATIVLARDPRWVGGTVGVLAVLHTWTQRLVFHPHVHCLVTGGGLSDDGTTWHPAGKTFLFPKSALATLARARFRNAFARLCPAADLPPHVWQIPWVVHITPWGQGQQAALDYLARYAFRIAITNNRILAVDDATVTYRYKDRAADRQRTQTVAGHEFIRRFLQHVLPAGFHKSLPRRRPGSAITACGMPRANCCATSGMFSCWRNPPGHRPNPHPRCRPPGPAIAAPLPALPDRPSDTAAPAVACPAARPMTITMLPTPTPPTPFRASVVPSRGRRRSPAATPQSSQIAPRLRPDQPIEWHQPATLLPILPCNLPIGSSYRLNTHPPR